MRDPYEPLGTVGGSSGASGYGFKSADIIGARVGIAKNAPERLRALGAYIVEQACGRLGNVWLSSGEFVKEVKRLAPDVSAQQVLVESVKHGHLLVEPRAGRIYLPKLHAAETELARSIAQKTTFCEPLTKRGYDDVIRFLKKNAWKINPAFAEHGLDEAQMHAIASIMTSSNGVHVLQGGPGTGKTSIIECIVWLLRNRKFEFAAPTGKAAKVLSNRIASTGSSASTICSLLRGTDEAGYEVNEKNPLDCDVLVIDETTMVGVQTAQAIFKATDPRAHIIFLGDPGRAGDCRDGGRAGQLPSISPGRFMHDLQLMPCVQSLELTKVFAARAAFLMSCRRSLVVIYGSRIERA